MLVEIHPTWAWEEDILSAGVTFVLIPVGLLLACGDV